MLFSPKGDLTQASKRSFAKSVVSACSSISSIRSARVGKRVAVDAGYERSFGDWTYEFAAILEFDTRSALVAYLRHPLHEKIGRLFWENCERTAISEVEVVDMNDPDIINALVS